MSLLVGMPSYDGTRLNAMAVAEILARDPEAVLVEATGCFLPANRNDIWCEALNSTPRPTRLLWLDSDIMPDPLENFVGLLESEMKRTGADILGSVYAMKFGRNETSVALDGTEGRPARRMQVPEISGKPVTWTDPRLLVGTGLVLVDFTKPWVEKVSFSTLDGIEKRGDRFVTVNDSEDYRWCRQARAQGASVYATTVLGTAHIGRRDHRIERHASIR